MGFFRAFACGITFRGSRRLLPPVLAIGFTVLMVGPTSAQTIHGRTIDAGSSAGIQGVRVSVTLKGRTVATTLTDSAGAFRVAVHQAGHYIIGTDMLGYAAKDSLPLQVDSNDAVEIEIRLSPTAMKLDAISVRGRREDPRHLATFEGFLARRNVLPPVGTSRAVLRDDPEMANAVKVGEVLSWFTQRYRCVTVFVNGRVEKDQGRVLEMSPSMLAGLEFYKNSVYAPMHMGMGGYCSVLAVWTHRDP